MTSKILAPVLASFVAAATGEPLEARGLPSGQTPAKPSVKAAPKSSATLSAAEQKVRERVTAYWKARMTMNLAACFPFYESAFRANRTPESFARDFRRLNRFAPEFLGVEAVALDAAGTRATVKTKLKTKVDALDGQVLVSTLEETWLLEDGEWRKAAEPLLPSI